MPIFTISTKNQITLTKEALQNLGINPGETIELELMLGRKAPIQADKPIGYINDLICCLANKIKKVLTLEEIKEAK
jgi:hypothetical protein